MLIRRGTPADAAAIAAVDVASWHAAYRGLMPDTFLDAITFEDKATSWAGSLEREPRRGKRTLVAEVGGTVVGYVTVGPDHEEGCGSILLMYVSPQFWGRGVGQALMGDAVASLRELGYARATLAVLERNDRARRFYGTAGWTAHGEPSVQDYGGVSLKVLHLSRSM